VYFEVGDDPVVELSNEDLLGRSVSNGAVPSVKKYDGCIHANPYD
jgi:hypothetical protein